MLSNKTIQAKTSILLLAIGAALCLSVLFFTHAAYAGNTCGGVDTAFDFNCPDNIDEDSGELENNPIYALLLTGINILAGGVGVAVVAFIIWGSILYASADGKSDQVQKGVSYIVNAIIGLVLFIAMYAIINFLVPGGILN